MTKSANELRQRLRDRPGAAARIDAHADAMRAVIRLQQARSARRVTQADLAKEMGTTQENVSRIERGDNPNLSTVGQYVTALGGRLEINAVFDDEVIPLATVEPTPALQHP